ncbi:hypothetical protein BJ170DRAFT_342563 [Xylariales sp. AK1849]|nr:hypothetical protein BJ170DRAFT_342563 [Xylariales sp. AK1849]
MDSRVPVFREELYNVQLDVKQLHHVQTNHTDRIARLEKHQSNETAIKSAWNSPFPSAIGGTPQHGPLQMPPSDLFDDLDEHGQNLLSNLHLDAEDEPIRRGAASRANSVRFDESALQGSSWAQNGRHSGDFGPIRPGSGMGSMMERSLSHKSDGRHSSAGHSVHSVHSHHSVASGRGSSLGLDTNYATTGSEEDSPIDMPEPPPGLFILGSVPSIVRCWLTQSFAHDTLLYADICTGSQKSVLEFSLIKELDLVDDIHRDLDGVHRIRLPVYLTEATITHPSSRGSSPAPQIPSLAASFEVVGIDQLENAEFKKGIRIFIGSETLREHSADILFSQNRMTLYGSERERLSVPFVRPEDNGVYKHIRTMAILPEKPKLNATARPFVLTEPKQQVVKNVTNGVSGKEAQATPAALDLQSPTSETSSTPAIDRGPSNTSESGAEGEKQASDLATSEEGNQDQAVSSDTRGEGRGDNHRREPAAGGIWSSWRQGASTSGSEQKDTLPLSGYQPPGRSRNMKVLKPSKPSAPTSMRAGSTFEQSAAPRTSGEHRRKSQPLGEGPPSGVLRWKPDRTTTPVPDRAPTTVVLESKPATTQGARDTRAVSAAPRSLANPVGGASAFQWMHPANKPKPTTTSD